jgi:hypothetical protein
MLAVLALITLLSCPAIADPWKDESGHGRWLGEYGYDDDRGRGRDHGYRRNYKRHYAGREYKEEFWYGGCKIERKWEANGNYKEERKCD